MTGKPEFEAREGDEADPLGPSITTTARVKRKVERRRFGFETSAISL
jgi:hypothetical protein